METKLNTCAATIPLAVNPVFDLQSTAAAKFVGSGKSIIDSVAATAFHREVLAKEQSAQPISGSSTIDGLLKRIIDLAVSAFLLLVTSPIFLILAILVSLDGGHVFFGHNRLGRGLRPFRCFKFRTMIPNAQATLVEYLALNPEAAEEWSRDHKLAADIRVTPVGRLLRRTSLDELPQLWNVLRGDMSLVGPRPITTQETARYGLALTQYASVRPGLTGLWQVSGRSDVTYEGRVALDARYVATRNLWSDLSILFLRTPTVLMSRRGAR